MLTVKHLCKKTKKTKQVLVSSFSRSEASDQFLHPEQQDDELQAVAAALCEITCGFSLNVLEESKPQLLF